MVALSAGSAAMYALLFFSLYFEVFLLVSWLERRRAPIIFSKKDPAFLPSVCIAVPCYNEARTVATTVSSLLRLDYPADKFEIIVVDDGSTDNTYAAALAFAHDSRVKVVRKENGGKHSAMNTALALTDAELIGCLDADSIVDEKALREIVPLFENTKIGAVTPGIHVREPKTILQHLQNVEYQLSVFNRFILAALGSVFITPGPFSIFRTNVIRELGGWTYAHSTEDMEMALRLQVAGHLIANAPRAIVHTLTPATFRALFRQRVRWTYGWLRNAVDYRGMIGNRAFGNLGILILPSALISIGAGIYFFLHVALTTIDSLTHSYVRLQIMGLQSLSPHYDLFYINTTAMWFLVWASVAIILATISIGSMIGRGTKLPPIGTPLFLLFYSFLVPLWLSAAVVRAVFKTGVRWK